MANRRREIGASHMMQADQVAYLIAEALPYQAQRVARRRREAAGSHAQERIEHAFQHGYQSSLLIGSHFHSIFLIDS